MTQCFYMMAIPEERCPNDGIWRGPGETVVDKFVWCDEHKHDSDVLTSTYKEGIIPS